MDDVEKTKDMSLDTVQESSSSDDYDYYDDSDEDDVNQLLPKGRQPWCTPLDLIQQKFPFCKLASQSWASEMSLYDKMSPRRSMESINIPRTPVSVPTPKEEVIDCKISENTNSNKQDSEEEKNGQSDTVIIDELKRKVGQKADCSRLSFSFESTEDLRVEGSERFEMTEEEPLRAEVSERLEMTEDEPSELSKSSSTVKSDQSSTDPVFDYKNLLVNYLPSYMDSTVLRSLFAPHGTIVSSKVVVDHASGISRGYGFVKFKSVEDGINAQKALHKFQIGGKTLKVSFSRRLQSGDKTKHNTNLYLSNLDPLLRQEDLERHFRTCGYVVQCKVLRNANGVSKQIGFVRYDHAESAQRAIDRFDGQQLEGTDRPIKIRIAGTPRLPPGCEVFGGDTFGSSKPLINSPPRVNPTSSACYVTGFHVSLSEKVLRRVFEPRGGRKVKSIRIIRRQNAPYAFVNFFNSEDAAAAAYSFNNTNLGECTLTVRLQT